MPSSSPPKPRLDWIDLLRGVAVLGMVETHVVNVFLSAEFDHAGWRNELSFFNGLLAPAFLWIAGYIQGLSIRKARSLARPVAAPARWRRLGWVAFLGFLLHVPWHLWLAGDFGPAGWQALFQVDILPCMALSLALLLAMGRWTGAGFDTAVGASLALAVFAAPWTDRLQTGLLPLDGFLGRSTGSLFPLLPWFGFCAAGCLASRWEWNWKQALPASCLMLGLGTILAPADFSKVHPAFFAERLGWLGLLAVTVKGLAGHTSPRWLLLAGRESLLVYVAHLVILHSIPAGGGLTMDRKIGRTLSLENTAMAFALLFTVSLALAWLNDLRKRHQAASAGKKREAPEQRLS